MNILNAVDLSTKHTFGLASQARRLIQLDSVDDIAQLAALTTAPIILGGGSNMLFAPHIQQDLLQFCATGYQVLSQTPQYCDIQVMAGTEWNQWVWQSLENGWQGLENLVEIPGTVGAAPVQNIGAFGVEACQYLTKVQAYDLQQQQWLTLSAEQCQFGYRDSLFKRHPDRFLITAVYFRLNQPDHYQCETRYADVSTRLQQQGLTQNNPLHIAQIIKEIRWAKLPRPEQYGNAGSFFKNPKVSAAQQSQLLTDFPQLVSFPFEDGYKLAAGWLIDQCGFKGTQCGQARVYPKQALVLCNQGQATFDDVMLLRQKIMDAVWQRFAVSLEPEVRIIESI